MDNDDDIPSGITSGPLAPELEPERDIPLPEEEKEGQAINVIKHNMANQAESKALRTDSNFRHRSSREGTRSKDKPKNKAVSEHFDLGHPLEHQRQAPKMPRKEPEKKVETINLPPAHHPKSSIRKREPIKEVQQKSHQFDRKEYRREQMLKDASRHPIKYKIMCDVFGCKPEVAFDMPRQEASYIQEGYMKQKGMEYLREGNSRARYNYIRDKRLHTEGSAKVHKSHSQSKKTTSTKGRSASQKILKLSAKEVIEGKLVYDKVKRHIKEGEKTHDYFKHLTSEESIDQALVKFLRTKIRRAEMVIK